MEELTPDMEKLTPLWKNYKIVTEGLNEALKYDFRKILNNQVLMPVETSVGDQTEISFEWRALDVGREKLVGVVNTYQEAAPMTYIEIHLLRDNKHVYTYDSSCRYGTNTCFTWESDSGKWRCLHFIDGELDHDHSSPEFDGEIEFPKENKLTVSKEWD
jgi:hypothetical protein